MQAQQQIEAENQALQEELQSLGEQVAQTEASMRELAALNQMFSTQVLHQSEQTRQLYQQVRTEVFLFDAVSIGTFLLPPTGSICRLWQRQSLSAWATCSWRKPLG